MVDRFAIEEGRFGRQLVLQSAWSEEIGELMRSQGIKELLVNYARGFKGNDITFVEDVPGLEVFWIIHRTIDDISPIHTLHELRSLKVDTYCKTPIDLAQFPRLEHCYLEWRKRVSSLFDRPCLKELWINKYDRASTGEFSQLPQLEQLSLANGRTADLGGVGKLRRLQFLGLYRLRHLTSLDGIQSARSLVTLEIQDCKNLRSLDEIRDFPNLRRLLFTDVGTVGSISFLEELTNLEEVLFYGSTQIEDGDLGPLTRLPNLRNVSFQNRRHYSHRREDFVQN